eukprot:scaffold45152_cov22-Tisochrysis_lutea.AAC.1
MSTHAPCGWSRKPKLHLIFNHEILVVGEEELGSGAHLAGSEMAADSVLAGAVMRAPSARAGSQINRFARIAGKAKMAAAILDASSTTSCRV